MILKYTQPIVLTLLIVLSANYFRFKYRKLTQKIILSFIILLVIGILKPFLSLVQLQLLLLVFIGINAFFFSLYGSIMTALLTFILYTIETSYVDNYILLTFLTVGTFIGILMQYLSNKKVEQNNLNKIMIKNSRLLNLYKEVNHALQQTTDMNKILHIITKGITTGHGLDFNRAMVLLLNEEKTTLNGVTGIGPMNAQEGFDVWEKNSDSKYKLGDLINNFATEQPIDYQIKQQVSEVEIVLDQDNFLWHVLKDGTTAHINNIDPNDSEQCLLASSFNMEEFVVFPLFTRNYKIGVLIVDNVISKKEFSCADIDSLIPIVKQASIAIQQAFLYAKVEEMALKDSLTNLMNLRALENVLQSIYSNKTIDRLSCIMIDIDFFKHYNDTNGHLLGNAVLIELAQVMKKSIRDADLPFRFGGEEFVVMLPNTNLADASKVAERLRMAVYQTEFPNGHLQPNGHLTISLGVASTDSLAINTSNHLISAADRALYRAKSLGRNKVVVAGEDEDNE